MKLIKENLSEFIKTKEHLNELKLNDFDDITFEKYPLDTEDEEHLNPKWIKELENGSKTFRDLVRNFINDIDNKNISMRTINKIYNEIITSLDKNITIPQKFKKNIFPFYPNNNLERRTEEKLFAEWLITYLNNEPAFEPLLKGLPASIRKKINAYKREKLRKTDPIIKDITESIMEKERFDLPMEYRDAENYEVHKEFELESNDLIVRHRYGEYPPLVIKHGDDIRRQYSDNPMSFTNAVRGFYVDHLGVSTKVLNKVYMKVSSATDRFILNNNKSYFFTDKDELLLNY